MDLINIERLFAAVTAVLHPLTVFKFVFVHIADDGSTVWAEFHAETIWIAVIHGISASVINAVLIHLAGFCLWNITFPEISVRYFVHIPFLPFIKFPDQSNA